MKGGMLYLISYLNHKKGRSSSKDEDQGIDFPPEKTVFSGLVEFRFYGDMKPRVAHNSEFQFRSNSFSKGSLAKIALTFSFPFFRNVIGEK